MLRLFSLWLGGPFPLGLLLQRPHEKAVWVSFDFGYPFRVGTAHRLRPPFAPQQRGPAYGGASVDFRQGLG